MCRLRFMGYYTLFCDAELFEQLEAARFERELELHSREQRRIDREIAALERELEARRLLRPAYVVA